MWSSHCTDRAGVDIYIGVGCGKVPGCVVVSTCTPVEGAVCCGGTVVRRGGTGRIPCDVCCACTGVEGGGTGRTP